MRHGTAASADEWAEDFERPLIKRGMTEVREMAQRLLRRDWVPQLLLVSPAERAWMTAEIVASVCELESHRIQCARQLYLATADGVWRLLGRQHQSLHHILICAHNPGLSDLASRLGPRVQTRLLPTAGIASALWTSGGWDELQPEGAAQLELDDPDKMAELV